MATIFENIIELSELIQKEHLEKKDEFPTSEGFLKKMMSYFAESREHIKEWLNLLRNAHYIFIINVVHPDPRHEEMEGIDAYVYAEKNLMEIIKLNSEKKLERIYEGTYYKKASPTSIERELFPQVKNLNNTPMGRALHEFVSVRNSLAMIDSIPQEFTEDWKKAKLREFLQDYAGNQVHFETDILPDEISSQSVVAKKEDIDINPRSPWGKLSIRFSPTILLKVHFRKYDFHIIKRLLRTGRIHNENELKIIRDEAIKLELEALTNSVVQKKIDELIDLRRYAQAKLNILKTKKEQKNLAND